MSFVDYLLHKLKILGSLLVGLLGFGIIFYGFWRLRPTVFNPFWNIYPSVWYYVVTGLVVLAGIIVILYSNYLLGELLETEMEEY